MRVEVDEPGETELLDVARVDLRERREALLGVGASMREPVAGILVGLDDARRVDLGRFDGRRGDWSLLLTSRASKRDQQRRHKSSREHVIPPTEPFLIFWLQSTADRPRPSSSRRVFHQAGLLPLPVAVLLGRALVVLLLSLGQSDAQLGAAVLPVQLQRHERVAATLDRADQPVQLRAAAQELARAGRVWYD